MDLQGSLTTNQIRIYPSKELKNFINLIPILDDTPFNIQKLINNSKASDKKESKDIPRKKTSYDDKDIKNLNKVKAIVKILNTSDNKETTKSNGPVEDEEEDFNKDVPEKEDLKHEKPTDNIKVEDSNYLNTDDIEWLYTHMTKQRQDGDSDIPYLHELFQGSRIELPENEIIKRNPILEARCIKLRAQQEAREYRKMTKGVDNVRMRFPEDSISYQMKQLNKQLIAIGQFIISIFAGFLFGFRGVEWMVGNLDFGFRLLLGVMCALVIALAEIYFLAKKLNEELNVPETVQLGGPPKFVNEPYFGYKNNEVVKKEHKD